MFSLCGYSDRLVTINKDDKSVHTIDHEYIPDATENGSITYIVISCGLTTSMRSSILLASIRYVLVMYVVPYNYDTC